MTVVFLLEALLARRGYVVAPDGYDVVTTVSRWIPYRFVLAHQRRRNAAGDTSERPWVSADVYVMPGAAVGQACLELVRSNSMLHVEGVACLANRL